MRICIVAVGKIKERGLRELLDDYLARVRRHVPCDEIEVKEGRNEEQSIRAAVPAGSHVIALEIEGVAMGSMDFSQMLHRIGSSGKGIVTFLIGGADGLPKAVSAQAQTRMSLSKLTLAHRVARVVLAEQIYRATTIWRKEPYHR